jgi:hypothetical protein
MKMTRKFVMKAEVANNKVAEMETVRGCLMAGLMGTLLLPMDPLETEGGAAKLWIRSFRVPKKDVGRVTQNLSTCKHYHGFPLPEAATDSSH